MADTLLKTVRITDDIKLEVYQQGSKRKYALFSDSYQTKTDKYDISMSDDDVIKEALITYNARYAVYSVTNGIEYRVTQDPYKDPLPKRTYGNGDKSPYYLNNGCVINIQWIGNIPNPEFNPGTYSNLESANRAGQDLGKPRYLKKVTITSSVDDADNSDTLPKSSWSVSPPITDGILEPKEVEPDYRDFSVVYNKIVTVTLPQGFTENEGKGYLVWTNHGLQYDTKALPNGTTYQETILVDGRAVTAVTAGDIIEYFDSNIKDEVIVKRVIENFKSDVTSLNGMSINDYDLKLCAPDTETCSLIEYKSPLEAPNKTPEQAAGADTPPVSTKPVSKLKFNIEGLPDIIEVKAKEDLPTFTVWAGSIPKPIGEQIDSFEDLSELDGEYTEGGFAGKEEAAGEFIATPDEVKQETAAAAEDAKTLGNDSSTGNNGYIVNGVPPNTPLPSNSLIPASFNGVPLYSQYDTRWSKSPYDWAPKGIRCGDSSTVASSGCGPSAVSMVINFWASKGYCSPVTPAIVAKFFADFGGRVCGSGSGLGSVPKDKFKEKFGIVLNSNATDAQVMKSLKQGYPCVVAGKNYSGYNYKGEKLTGKYSGGHFVCLTGIDSEGRVRVNDSGNNPAGGKAITAFLEGKTPAQSRGVSQTAILYPANMSAPV